MALRELLDHKGFIVIGVVHLPPLPGSPRGSSTRIEDVIEVALRDSRALEESGVDAIIIENYGDKPFTPRVKNPLVIASMTAVVYEVKRSSSIPIGVNLLRNSGPEAVAVAYAARADFVRVNAYCEHRVSPEGMLEPVMHEVEYIRNRLPRRIDVIADIDVKHSTPLTPSYDPLTSVDECLDRGEPDIIAVTGPRTGKPPAPGYVAAIRERADGTPVLVASGVTLENIRAYIDVCDGVIVGSFFKEGGVAGNRVDAGRVRMFVERVKELVAQRKSRE